MAKTRKKKRRSAAQRAATRKMLAALAARRSKASAAPRGPRYGAKRKRKKSGRRKSAFAQGRHRPVVIKRRGKLYRPKRSMLPARAAFVNPFLGELAMIGNPHKKRLKSHRKSHRRSRHYSNPLAMGGAVGALTRTPRELVRPTFLQEAASVAVGFWLPNQAVQWVPPQWTSATWSRYAVKVAAVSLSTWVAGRFFSKKVRDAVLLGGGLAVLLDVYAEFVAPALGGFAPRLREDVGAYYGEPTNEGVGAYYGETTNAGVAGFEEGY